MEGKGAISVRAQSWDRAIFANVIGGEYGEIDVRGRTVVDIGAHIGSFSLLAAMKGARRVLAYEAGTDNFDLLVRNCGTLPAVECHHAAVWRSDAHGAELSWRPASTPENTGGGTVIECAAVAGEPADAGRRSAVATVPFDDIVERAGTVDLLKIDAEGSEYPILLTSRKLDRIGTIVGEFHDIAGLDARMAIPGVPDWTVERLRAHLERQGFDVDVRRRGALGFFRATRKPSRR